MPSPSPGKRQPVKRGMLKSPPPDEPSTFGFLWTVLGCLLLIALAGGSVFWVYARPGPSISEKALILGLTADVNLLRNEAAKSLRDYPTRDTAVALVVFLNAMTAMPVPEDPAKETPEEKAGREQVYRDNLSVAETALKSLCLITGRAFGTRFKLDRPHVFTWSEVAENQWSAILFEVNAWATQELGAGLLLGAGLRDRALERAAERHAARLQGEAG